MYFVAFLFFKGKRMAVTCGSEAVPDEVLEEDEDGVGGEVIASLGTVDIPRNILTKRI